MISLVGRDYSISTTGLHLVVIGKIFTLLATKNENLITNNWSFRYTTWKIGFELKNKNHQQLVGKASEADQLNREVDGENPTFLPWGTRPPLCHSRPLTAPATPDSVFLIIICICIPLVPWPKPISQLKPKRTFSWYAADSTSDVPDTAGAPLATILKTVKAAV